MLSGNGWKRRRKVLINCFGKTCSQKALCWLLKQAPAARKSLYCWPVLVEEQGSDRAWLCGNPWGQPAPQFGTDGACALRLDGVSVRAVGAQGFAWEVSGEFEGIPELPWLVNTAEVFYGGSRSLSLSVYVLFKRIFFSCIKSCLTQSLSCTLEALCVLLLEKQPQFGAMTQRCLSGLSFQDCYNSSGCFSFYFSSLMQFILF